MIKIIVPVGYLKDGMVCYKITGTKPYTVKRIIMIDGKNFVCHDTAVFLLDKSGVIQSYSSDFEVKYIAEDIEDIKRLYNGE